MTEPSASAEAYERGLVRGWCQAVTAATFVDTVNLNDRPLPTAPIWFTVHWHIRAVARVTYSGLVKETGELRVIVAGRARRGAGIVQQAARVIVAELLARKDPERQFLLEFGGEAVDMSVAGWHRLAVPLAYQLHRDESEITISTTNVVAKSRQAAPDQRERPKRKPKVTEKAGRKHFLAAKAADPRVTFSMWAGDKPFGLACETVYRYWGGKSWSDVKGRSP